MLLSVIYAFVLFNSPTFRGVLTSLGGMGYVGAFIGGMLFVSTFSVSIGMVALIMLAKVLHPAEMLVFAGLGAFAGDMIIFQYVRSRGLVDEIKHFFEYFGGDHLQHLFHTKYFAWSLPVIGALIMASPLPDELGVSLMGISKMSPYKFAALSLLLNGVSIFTIIFFASWS